MSKVDWPTFEELSTMAKNDPEKFEAFRLSQIEKTIESAPSQIQNRLRGLQFQVDCQRKIHKSPMGACLAISKMMHQSLAKLHDTLNGTPSRIENRTNQQSNIIELTAKTNLSA